MYTPNITTVADVDVTSMYQNWISSGFWNRWMSITGQDSGTGCNSGFSGSSNITFKVFDLDQSYVNFTYTYSIAPPTFAVPSSAQIFTDPDASFKLNYESNPNNSTPLQ